MIIFYSYIATFVLLQVVATSICFTATGMPWDQWLSLYKPPFTTGVVLYLSVATLTGFLYLRMLVRIEFQWKNHYKLHGILGIAIIVFSAIVYTPSRSVDPFSYLSHGYYANQNLGQIYANPASDIVNTEYGERMERIGDLPPNGHGISPYGPIWTYIEYFAVRASGLNIFAGLIVLRIFNLIAFLGCAILTWLIFCQIAFARRWWGLFAALFNPLVLQEFLFELHNDAWVALFTLAAVYFAVNNKSVMGGLGILGAILTKYLPVIHVPALARHFILKDKRWRVHAGIAVALSLVISALFFWPIWIGVSTFNGVRETTGLTSLGRLIAYSLGHLETYASNNWFEQNPGFFFFPALMIYAILYFAAVRRSGEVTELAESCAIITLAYFVLLSKLIWAWYLTVPILLLILCRRADAFRLVGVCTFVGLLNAPVFGMVIHSRHFVPELVPRAFFVQDMTMTLPLLFVLGFYIWRWYRYPQIFLS